MHQEATIKGCLAVTDLQSTLWYIGAFLLVQWLQLAVSGDHQLHARNMRVRTTQTRVVVVRTHAGCNCHTNMQKVYKVMHVLSVQMVDWKCVHAFVRRTSLHAKTH